MFIIVWNEVSGFWELQKRESASLKLSEKKPCWIARVCLVAQLRPTLWHPMDCSPPGASVRGDILQAECWSGLLCPPPGDLPWGTGNGQMGVSYFPLLVRRGDCREEGKINRSIRFVSTQHFSFFCFLLKYSCIVLVSGVQKSDSIIHEHLCLYSPFKILFVIGNYKILSI